MSGLLAGLLEAVAGMVSGMAASPRTTRLVWVVVDL